jgi:hypothetical protein
MPPITQTVLTVLTVLTQTAHIAAAAALKGRATDGRLLDASRA